MRAIYRAHDDPLTPASAAQFSVEVIGDELAGFVEAGADLDDLPSFKDRLQQYRAAVERAMVETSIENAARYRRP